MTTTFGSLKRGYGTLSITGHHSPSRVAFRDATRYASMMEPPSFQPSSLRARVASLILPALIHIQRKLIAGLASVGFFNIKPLLLDILADLLEARGRVCEDPHDTEEAIQVRQKAIESTLPQRHESLSDRLSSLGGSLLDRYERSCRISDLDMAISALDQSVCITSGNNRHKPARLGMLGLALAYRFERLGSLGDVDAAIEALWEAVGHAPKDHTDRPTWLSNLGGTLCDRFERKEELEDVDSAILALEEAVRLTPADDGDRPFRLSNLGTCYGSRFKRLGELKDLSAAIDNLQEAISIAPNRHPRKPGILSNLGNMLFSRYGRLRDIADIDTAVSLHQQAITLTPDGQLDKLLYLNNLAIALITRSEHSGDVIDINMAIEVLQKAVNSTPEDHPDRLVRLSNLASSLHTRFERLGQIVDIDRSISIHHTTIDMIPDSHAKKPDWLNNLGNAFLGRFEKMGETSDVNMGCSSYRKAIELTPDGHAKKSFRLRNLADSLQRRFEKLHEMDDINESVSIYRKAIALTPQDHPDRPDQLSGLGRSLHLIFQHTWDVKDIDASIVAHQQAVELTPIEDAQRPTRLNGLGNSFYRRFMYSKSTLDIDSAIHFQQEAIGLMPNGHVNKPNILNNIGSSYRYRFDHCNDISDIQKAIKVYTESAKSSSGIPLIRFIAAKHWANLCFRYSKYAHAALEPYSLLIELLPRIVWLGKGIHQRFDDINAIGTTVNEAAAAACALGWYDVAVEWLEQGRSIIWGQMLNLRTPMDDLAQDHPEIAQQLKDVAHRLENPRENVQHHGRDNDIILFQQSNSSSMAVDGQVLASLGPEAAAQSHRRLAEKWEELLVMARRCPGFENFLLPKKLSDLHAASRSTTVAIVNIDELRCDVLILRANSSSIKHIHLPDLRHRDIQIAHKLLSKVLNDPWARQRERTPDETDSDQELNGIVYSMLSQSDSDRDGRASRIALASHGGGFEKILLLLWTKIVKPVLDSLGYTSQKLDSVDQLPHITWCTTGLLAFLPLHAAGQYTGSGAKVYEYVVSSYTPSLSALINPMRDGLDQSHGLLAISQPLTPGMGPLPGTVAEVTKIQKLMSDKRFTWLNAEKATVASVLEAMKEYSWIHLACHGLQDRIDPIKSAFALYDGFLTLEMISQKSLRHAELAFLSACQTATGDRKFPNESMHLAAGMLMAGYKTVLATMWSISDRYAPLVAEEVYEELVKEIEITDGQVAYALHKAVGSLRRQIGETEFLGWVPFVHFGL